MSLVDPAGIPVSSRQTLDPQLVQMLTGVRIRVDAANAQLVQLGLLVEFLYENLEKQDIKMPMDDFPTWAESRYKEIQEAARQAMEEGGPDIEELKKTIKQEVEAAGIDLSDE